VRRFTFAEQNAKKFLSLPLYGLGSLASLLVPRSAGRWVFGCGSGVGEGALQLIELVRAQNPRLKVTWLARTDLDRETASARGFDAVLTSSARGLWLTLRAQVVVVTHGFGDVNRYGIRGAFVVQLWHGIPLKLIHLDSPATLRSSILPRSKAMRWLLERMYRRAASAIRMMPAASELSARRLRTAFGLPADRVVVTGDPRDDVLLRGDAHQRTAAAKATLGDLLPAAPLEGARVVLYAPTLREGDPDPAVPTAAQWTLIGDYLAATNSVLLLRSHPLGIGEYAAGPASSDRIWMFGKQLRSDATELLAGVDVLITDYSSIAFDFALTGGSLFFLAPDRESYALSRGLYEPYPTFSGGREVTTWEDLIALMRRCDEDAELASAVRHHAAELADRHHAFRDGRNTERVYVDIIQRLKGHA
jgi:CDP-glycerol glycerophosphotransferase (TagB/SpsB family)